MKFPKFPLPISACLVAFLSLGSCVSTEVVDPGETQMSCEEKLVLDLSPEIDAATRATADHSGHKLRFIAKLYQGENGNNLTSNGVYVRKELILGDQAEDAEEINQIVFDVPAGNYYTIFLYADYIPSEATKDSAGEYGDYYYDTHSSKIRVSMFSTPKSSETVLSPEYFNNDNYDLFHAYLEVYKTPEKVERSVTLKRCVAKVRFVDTSGATGNYDLTVSSLKKLRNLTTMTSDGAAAGGQYTHNTSTDVYTAKTIEPDENNESEFLFYYVCANTVADSQCNSDLSFTVTNEKGEKKEYRVTSIPTRQNYITTVKSGFLPDSSGDGEEEDPTPDDNLGPIILNLSVSNQDWEHQVHNWSN